MYYGCGAIWKPNITDRSPTEVVLSALARGGGSPDPPYPWRSDHVDQPFACRSDIFAADNNNDENCEKTTGKEALLPLQIYCHIAIRRVI